VCRTTLNPESCNEGVLTSVVCGWVCLWVVGWVGCGCSTVNDGVKDAMRAKDKERLQAVRCSVLRCGALCERAHSLQHTATKRAHTHAATRKRELSLSLSRALYLSLSLLLVPSRALSLSLSVPLTCFPSLSLSHTLPLSHKQAYTHADMWRHT